MVYQQKGNEVVEVRKCPVTRLPAAFRGLRGALAVTTLLATATHGGLSMLVQLHLEDLTAPPLTIGLTSTLTFLGTALGSILWGLIASRFKIERLILWVLGLSQVLAGFLALLLRPLGTLLVAFCYALSSSGLFPIILALTSEETPRKRRGRGLSIIAASRELGLALGTLSAGGLVAFAEKRTAFAVLAGVPVLCFFALIRLTGSSPGQTETRALRDTGSTVQGSLGMMYLGAVLRWFGTAGSFSLIYVYMGDLGFSDAVMGAVSAMGPLVATLAMLCLGILSDRVGRRIIFVAGFGLSIFVPILFGVATSADGMILAFVVSGTSIGALYVGATGYIADRTDTRKHSIMLGLFEACRSLGGILGPIAAGAMVPHVGFRGMFWAMSVVTALGFLSVSRLRDTRVRR